MTLSLLRLRLVLALALLAVCPSLASAAITLVGVAEASAINGGDVTIILPSLQQDDVCYVGGGFPRTGLDPGVSTAGYTELVDFDSANYGMSVSRKVMGAVPDATATGLGSGNASDAVTYVAICLRGVDTGTPEDATTTTATGSSTDPNPPSITTVTNSAWVLPFAAGNVNDASVVAPTNYTNQVDITAADTRDSTAGGATREITVAGTENPAAWTTWATSVWTAATVAVRPAGGGPACPKTLPLVGVGRC